MNFYRLSFQRADDHYGGIRAVHPATNLTNLLAALESFTGILTFALITGLIYARFSQPRAYLRFSDHALISPHRGSQALMFRLASYKNNNLTNVTAQVILALHERTMNGRSPNSIT